MTATTPQVLNPPVTPAPPVVDLDREQRERRRKLIVLLILLAGLLILLLLFGWYLIFRQPINPLPAIPVSQVPKYQASLYGVKRPVGIAVSPGGDRIYVTQGAATPEGLVLDGSGKPLGRFSSPAARSGDNQPVYPAIDPLTQQLYVSDRLAGTIYVFGADGAYLRELVPASPIPGWQPLGLAFDTAGLLYVTDLSGTFQKIEVIDRSGKVVRLLGKDDRLNFPNGIVVTKDGTILVTDSDNGRLIAYGKDDKSATRVGRGAGQGLLGLPRGLGIDGQGRIFAVDTSGQHVAIYRDPGSAAKPFDFLGAFGDEGVADSRLNFPTSVALDTRGRVYVTDTFNDRIQVWSY